MGVDIDGKMIVGCQIDDVELPESVEDKFGYFIENLGLAVLSECFDADSSEQVVGFIINDVHVLTEDFDKWVSNVKKVALEFKKITGCEPKLIGMQDVW
jgi:hypothetical protein